MSDAGLPGPGCAARVGVSDYHLLTDTFALFPYPHRVEAFGVTVSAFVMTTLLPISPKVMLNVETDDFGIVEERHCGCELEACGYTTHLREVRSYSKLTGEGVTLIGDDMIHILETALPARFGGTSFDYQLMEDEDEQGFTRLFVTVSPRVELQDERAVIECVLDGLRRASPATDAARLTWQNAQTLRVRRGEPVWTGRKFSPLYMPRRYQGAGVRTRRPIVRPVAYAVLLLAVSAACSGPSTPAPAAGQDAVPGSRCRPHATIRMDIPLEPDVSDVPRLMARDALQQAGYTVVSTAYRDNVIAIQALVEGQVDIALLSLPAVLAAIQRGAGIAIIMGGGSHTRCLVTAPELTKCSDLHHRQVSVPNLVSSQTLALQRYISNRCPGTSVEPVVISGTGNRLAALLARRTDGAILDLMTLLEVQHADGPAFNVLSEFGAEFPGLGGAAMVASRAFLDSHPDAARDLVRECLLATRTIQDPAVLTSPNRERISGWPRSVRDVRPPPTSSRGSGT